MTFINNILLSTTLLVLLSASTTMAASITVNANGDGIFVIEGRNMSPVAGIELNITYDKSSLGAPFVSQGSLISRTPGTMLQYNPDFNGGIKIIIAGTRSFSGSGPIATITFGNHTGSGTVSLNGIMMTTSGSPVAGSVRATANDFNPPVGGTITGGSQNTVGNTNGSGNQENSGNQNTKTTSQDTSLGNGGGGNSTNRMILGTVSIPMDAPLKDEIKQPNPSDPVSPVPPSPVGDLPPNSEVNPAVRELPTTETPKIVQTIHHSVLDRFRMYQGEHTPARMMELFIAPVATTISQSPPIVISDGITKVIIAVELPAGGHTSPNFALTGASQVSLNRQESSGKWLLEILPQAKAMKASVTILDDTSVTEYPLTVVPPVANFSTREADFAAFLKASGAKPALNDLNGDGRHDYQDDFIYTAHYLLRKGEKTVETKDTTRTTKGKQP